MDKDLVKKMMRSSLEEMREDLAKCGSRLSWVQADLAIAERKIARVQALMEKYRTEKRFDVADAIRETINGKVE